jgi:hypothetical protein
VEFVVDILNKLLKTTRNIFNNKPAALDVDCCVELNIGVEYISILPKYWGPLIALS